MAGSSAAGTSAVYGLKFGARCVSAVLGASDVHRFLVGTNSCKDKSALNEVHSIEFDDDSNTVKCQNVYSHPAGEVWHITPAPTKPELFLTTYRSNAATNTASGGAAAAAAAASAPDTASAASIDNHRVSLWKTRDEKSEALSKLDEIVELKGHTGSVRACVWSPAGDERVVTCDAGAVRLWTLNTGAAVATATVSGSLSIPQVNGGAWDPHRPEQFTVLQDKSIRCIDLRTMKESVSVPKAHDDTIRDADYNPNKPSYIVTCGDDRKIKFWDIRKFGAAGSSGTATPLRVLTGHTHWVSTVRYNRAHDQLVLSGSSDSSVKLWSIVSISSAPLGELEDPANEKEGDKLIKTFDEHEDSVYAVSWSAKDAWVFASVSHGGQVVFNHVPQAEKYKILL